MNKKVQRITIEIDGVEYKGIVTTKRTEMGLVTEVLALTDTLGNEHDDLSWRLQRLATGEWLNYRITALEPLNAQVPAEG